ncbi:MAG TPA: hypothetical protein VJ842_09715 [Pyrinomonadaceae bacterium]|nr:hypothetical protein [Pyrinomonadaceae bacterium]
MGIQSPRRKVPSLWLAEMGAAGFGGGIKGREMKRLFFPSVD